DASGRAADDAVVVAIIDAVEADDADGGVGLGDVEVGEAAAAGVVDVARVGGGCAVIAGVGGSGRGGGVDRAVDADVGDRQRPMLAVGAGADPACCAAVRVAVIGGVAGQHGGRGADLRDRDGGVAALVVVVVVAEGPVNKAAGHVGVGGG